MIRCLRFHTLLSTIALGLAVASACPSVVADTLHAAVLPLYKGDRSSLTNSYVATLINDSKTVAKNCRIEIDDSHNLVLRYWTTNREDNVPTGQRNSSVDISPGESQSFLFNLRAYAEPDRETGLIFPTFTCDNRNPAGRIDDVNGVSLDAFGFSRLRTFSDRELAILPGLIEKIEDIGPGSRTKFREAEMEFLHRNGLP